MDGARRGGDMLDTLLTWLEEVREVCYTKGVEVGILGGYHTLASVGALTLQAVVLLEIVESPTVAPGAVRHGSERRGARYSGGREFE